MVACREPEQARPSVTTATQPAPPAPEASPAPSGTARRQPATSQTGRSQPSVSSNRKPPSPRWLSAPDGQGAISTRQLPRARSCFQLRAHRRRPGRALTPLEVPRPRLRGPWLPRGAPGAPCPLPAFGPLRNPGPWAPARQFCRPPVHPWGPRFPSGLGHALSFFLDAVVLAFPSAGPTVLILIYSVSVRLTPPPSQQVGTAGNMPKADAPQHTGGESPQCARSSPSDPFTGKPPTPSLPAQAHRGLSMGQVFSDFSQQLSVVETLADMALNVPVLLLL